MFHHNKTKHKVLFLLKYRQLYQDVLFDRSEESCPYHYFSSGLLNSAKEVQEMLVTYGVESKLVQVVDNNDIDREVTKYQPTDVIIEALWVVPEKFDVLQKLHPNVRWIVRLHSEVPFIANEGMAFKWILAYLKQDNVTVGVNSERMLSDLKAILPESAHCKLLYLPNYYNYKNTYGTHHVEKHFIDPLDIGCFGAIRTLKNQLLQAMAAIRFADVVDRPLRFHINGYRVENNSNNVLKNIRELFNSLDPTRYQLVEHEWLDQVDFIKLCSTMDMGMQVSMSETFSIIAAQFVQVEVPVVVSKEISWASCLSKVEDATSIHSIVETMVKVWLLRNVGATLLNKMALHKYNKHSVKEWLRVFE